MSDGRSPRRGDVVGLLRHHAADIAVAVLGRGKQDVNWLVGKLREAEAGSTKPVLPGDVLSLEGEARRAAILDAFSKLAIDHAFGRLPDARVPADLLPVFRAVKETAQAALRVARESEDKLKERRKAVGSHQRSEGQDANALLTSTKPKRPYAHLVDHKSVGQRKRFTKSQKMKILLENARRNGGILRDDETRGKLVFPKKHRKGVRPPDNEAHIDHIFSRSKGGTNSFSNASVRSRRNNLKKSNNP